MSNILWLNNENLPNFTAYLCGENAKHIWQNNPLMLHKNYVMLSHLLSAISATICRKFVKCPFERTVVWNGSMHKIKRRKEKEWNTITN